MTMRTLILVLVASTALPAAADTYPRQPNIDALHYKFRVEVGDESDEIKGEATVDLRFNDRETKAFFLDLTSVENGKGMTVSEVTSQGATMHYTHESHRLRIALDTAPEAGAKRTVTVRYRGTPAGGLRIGKNKHGDRTFFSENWPDNARHWLPMIDHPYDKATSEFLVTAPARYQVVSNGLLQEETDLGDGRRLTHWKQSVPIASWLNAVGVAQFASFRAGDVKGIPLEVWAFRQEREPGLIAFESPARRALEFYSEHVGAFPYEKLANVEAAGLQGGTEHASAIFYGEGSVNGKPATGLVAHEVAHQWFGDSVTEHAWDDIWLSEGFATYFALLFTEHDQGRDAFVRDLKRSREMVLAAERRMPGTAVLHQNLSDTKKILNPIVYQKGGWTLHMLRRHLGDEPFWAGIRAYYGQYRDRSASTDDFRRVMQESSGMDLAWFFDQWLKRAGSPVVEGTWRYLPESKSVKLELNQKQTGEPYRLALEVGIQEAGSLKPRIETIQLAEAHGSFEFKSEKAPETVSLDPNVWTLMDARLRGE